MKIDKDDKLAKSKDLLEEDIQNLKQLFPEAFTETSNGISKIDFVSLKEVLGEYIDNNKERYSFNWAGKQQARREAQKVSTGTLRPCPEESVNFDTTENLYIEGDNLEVLKLLQKSYHNKVKMIYIDPPYNTGKDFIYKDNYRDNLKNYKELTGQLDSEGNKLSTNSESAGRYHSNWLNMMYPRLKLARNLLKDNGAIFISIDDNEVHNLRKICDMVFGEENFVANIVWQKKYSVSNDDPSIAAMHDHILVYKKSDAFQRGLFPRSEKQLNRYKNPENDPRGDWASGEYVSSKTKEERPTLWYPIKHPKTGEDVWPDPKAVWRYSFQKHREIESDDRLYWGVDYSYKLPRLKRFLSEIKGGVVPSTWWTFNDAGHNDEGQKETASLVGKKIFSTPKPIKLIKQMLTLSADKDDIILDFFAGSCATAHAVMDMNVEKNMALKFMMVQLPEPCGEKSEAFNSGFKTIADIGKERIRRVIETIEEELADNLEFNENKLDFGFKVLKLDSSNIKSWDPEPDDLEKQLELMVDNIKPDRKEEDILFEIMLKYGLDLTLPVEARTTAGNKIFNVGYGALIACLSHDITLETVEGIGKLKEELKPETCRVIFMDNGFKNDTVKTNAMQILARHGIEEVRSI